MTAHRYNFYKFIHKGIRRELGELLRLAAALDFEDQRETGPYLARLHASLALMGAHAHHEDAHIEPLVERFAPALARRIFATHRVLDQQEHELLRRAEAAREYPDVGHTFYLALTRYVATQLGHMAEEESEVMELLWEHLGDEEIIAIEGAIVGSCAPEENAVYMEWMMRGVSEPERVAFLAAMRMGAPPEAVAHAEQLAQAAREARAAA